MHNGALQDIQVFSGVGYRGITIIYLGVEKGETFVYVLDPVNSHLARVGLPYGNRI